MKNGIGLFGGRFVSAGSMIVACCLYVNWLGGMPDDSAISSSRVGLPTADVLNAANVFLGSSVAAGIMLLMFNFFIDKE
jgi:hypothetical protein